MEVKGCEEEKIRRIKREGGKGSEERKTKKRKNKKMRFMAIEFQLYAKRSYFTVTQITNFQCHH